MLLSATATASALSASDTPVSGVPLGGNVQQQTAYVQDHAYVNLVKAAKFVSPTGGGVATDSMGWPLADFAVMVVDSDYGSVNVAPGVYNLSFTGPSTTTVSLYQGSSASKQQPVITKVGYNAATGVNTYTVTVPAGVPHLGLAFTHTNGQVKNLQVLQPGYSLSNYPVYTAQYINFMQSLHPYDLRFMDFTNTNGNLTANWSNRTVPADATYVTNGAPWEDVILLANEVHSNVWINVPYHATDDYVTQLAQLFKTTLDPSLNIYLEFSNEVWNTAFEQGAANCRTALADVQAGVKSGHPSNLNYDNQAVSLTQTNPFTNEVITWADRLTAQRLLQIGNIFKSVWTSAGAANPIDTRVRPILCGQGPILSRFSNMLGYINAEYGAPKNYFYGIGIGPYFGLNLYQDSQGSNGQWTTLNKNITESQALYGMSQSIGHYATQNVFADTLAYGAKYGLKLEAYEGGEDSHGPFNIAAKKAASLDPAIEPLIAKYLNEWYSQGGDVFDWYRLGAGDYDTPSGTFPISDDITNLNQPKEEEFRIYRGYAPAVPAFAGTTATPSPTPAPTPTPKATTIKPAVAQQPVSAVTAAGTVPLGGNLNQQTDRIEDHPFVDLVKVTRGFFNLAGRIDKSTGAAAKAYTNAQGWPTEDFAFSANDQSEYGTQVTPGTYHLSFTGAPGVVVTMRSTAPGPRSGPAIATNKGTISLVRTGFNSATGEYTYNVVVPNDVYVVAFNFTSTKGSVRNIHLIQPGYNPNNYPVYTATYLSLLKTLNPNVLRFMDFTQTNSNPDINWSDRTLPNGPNAATNGVSWEDVITLANDLQKGVWINVPAMASDAYVTQLATLLKNTLSPGLPIYVEYSNEVWNYQFSQASYNKKQAVAEVTSNKNSNLNYDHLANTSGNQGIWAARLYARRAMQISNIFKSVWTGAGLANPINSRVRMVLGGQAANISAFNNPLTYISKEYGAPKNFFYSLAIAPYVELNKYADQYGDTHVTAAQALQGFALSIAHYQSTGVFTQAFALANSYGLKLDAYEAGEDTYGSLNIAAKAQAVLSPENETLMEQFLNLWYSSGGDQLNWYTLGARSYNTMYGSWSITNSITDLTEPRELAFEAIGKEARP